MLLKQLLVISALLIIVFSCKAQQTQRIYYGLKAGASLSVDVFNTNNYTSDMYIGPLGGLYADFCLYKRLWLFAGMDIAYGFGVKKNYSYPQPELLPATLTYPSIFRQIALAYRISKDDSKWQLYPYAGTSAITWGFYNYPLVGFETKREFGKCGSIAIGINGTFNANVFGKPKITDLLGHTNLYIKIGFGALKKREINNSEK